MLRPASYFAYKYLRLLVAIPALGMLTLATARAETIRIVALGASNAYGQAVGASAAWPAKLEAMLRAKGYDVSVTVMAVTSGDANMVVSKAGSIPAGTKVVVYDVGGGNSADRGVNTKAARPQIEKTIRAHGAVPIWAAYNQIIGSEKSNPSAWIQGDTHHHFTAASHTRVAASLMPKVAAAIGKKK